MLERGNFILLKLGLVTDYSEQDSTILKAKKRF